MKKAFAALLIPVIVLSLISCRSERSAEELMRAFVDAYKATGVIYSSSAKEGDDGYIDSELFNKIYLTDGRAPSEFAVFLNLHTDHTSECAVFVCRDGDELMRVERMCLERVALLSSEAGFVVRSHGTVFYSTMSDKARAQRLWHSIISR